MTGESLSLIASMHYINRIVLCQRYYDADHNSKEVPV